ncbi:MAG: response regulator transcription factor [Pseudanabaenaceae cyanobacterium SKYGB_i_bin29]|nr:response regulator transcription factor [Pseudanabaenaceae cyanobacterium SKYG29]MDW8421614.1 response regulator transcription factor [Pseudanabaenaceae cyanobacterium SKYGB_i_bin29]
MAVTVQIVESNLNLGSLLRWHLQEANYRVYLTSNIQQAKEVFSSKFPAVIVIDTDLADGSGIDLCKWIFPQNRAVVMLISNQTKESDIIKGLEAGADDYLKKPFGLGEFLARVAVLARRARRLAPPAILELPNLRIDLIQRVVKFRGKTIELTPQEFSLLYVLAQGGGTPLSRQELLQRAWDGTVKNHRTVDSHIQSLRKKLDPSLILTVRNVGYAFNHQSK